MNRREVIALLGGAAAAGSQPGRRANRTDRPDVAGFLQALQQLGWSEGHNLRIDYRWGRGNAADTRKYAQELVALAPDVLLVSGASSLTPLLQATRTLPIVFTSVADPVGAGLRREHVAAGRQRHRLYSVRVQPERQMAGVAQASRAGRDPRRRPARPGSNRRRRRVRRDPVGRLVGGNRGRPGGSSSGLLGGAASYFDTPSHLGVCNQSAGSVLLS